MVGPWMHEQDKNALIAGSTNSLDVVSHFSAVRTHV